MMDETSELLRSAVSRARFCVAPLQSRGVDLGHEVTKTGFVYLEVQYAQWGPDMILLYEDSL